MFSTLQKRNFNFSVTFVLSSAISFNLDQSKNLSIDKVLRAGNHQCTFFFSPQLSPLFGLKTFTKNQASTARCVIVRFICNFVESAYFEQDIVVKF